MEAMTTDTLSGSTACEPTTTITVTLEHIKTFNEARIRVMTKYACA